ncbi:ependymin-like isoform X2 [Heptranchias perlo]|uniref:ependymin-like isoform X2 n=1 Tax=Heptranchias perlo TaxID=212740 RepID=UPI003559F8C2
MKLLAALSICSLSFLVTEGGKPEPCSAPKLLEGRKIIINVSKKVLDMVKFSYNAVQKKVYLNKEGNGMGTVEEFFLFEEAIMYRFHPQNRTCEKSPLHTPFHEIAVPQESTFYAQIFIGGSSASWEGMFANIWLAVIGDSAYTLTVTESGCLPVSAIIYNNESGYAFESFYDLSIGISDPSVFFPPSECTNLN